MGNRHQARFKSVLPVRIWWAEPDGTRHSHLTHTLDINQGGARLGGIRERISVDDVLTVQYKQRRADFKVRWVGKPGTRTQYQVGIQALEPDKALWGELPKDPYSDTYAGRSSPSAPAAASPVPAPVPVASRPAQVAPPPPPGPVVQPAPVAELVTPETAKIEITRRLQRATEELCEIDELLKAGAVDPKVLEQFREALALARHTAWGVQQWFELQQRGDQDFPLLSFLSEERLVVATRVCQNLARDVTELSVRVEPESMEALIGAVGELAEGLTRLQIHAEGSDSDRMAAEAERSLRTAVPEIEKAAAGQAEPKVSMQVIVQRALAATGADGIAVTRTEGAEMVCQASAGVAPEAGVRWYASSGLSGEALRVRQPVKCEDTESDPRVDPVLCRAANLRSCLIVPILLQQAATGTLEAYSSRPNAFLPDHVRSLTASAKAIAAILERQGPNS